MSNKDKKNVVWMGEIPFGQEDKFRYPTEEEVEMAFYEADNLTVKEYDNMTEKEKEDFYRKAKKVIKEKLNAK
jgi:hypothetical protein|tara:strand:+ start:1181 stop:1399 length:219 start_codon:yes stop_codon:yes gene_type:complete